MFFIDLLLFLSLFKVSSIVLPTESGTPCPSDLSVRLGDSPGYRCEGATRV